MTAILFGGRDNGMDYIPAKTNSFTLAFMQVFFYQKTMAIIGFPHFVRDYRKGYLLFAYSYRSAVTGSSRAALTAG
jgi:hypothetical protein